MIPIPARHEAIVDSNCRIVRPVIGDLIQQLELVALGIDLCIHALCNNVCEIILGRSVGELDNIFTRIKQWVSMRAANCLTGRTLGAFDHSALAFASGANIEYQFGISVLVEHFVVNVVGVHCIGNGHITVILFGVVYNSTWHFSQFVLDVEPLSITGNKVLIRQTLLDRVVEPFYPRLTSSFR